MDTVEMIDRSMYAGVVSARVKYGEKLISLSYYVDREVEVRHKLNLLALGYIDLADLPVVNF